MSYTPHTWVIKESITASKLNNIEAGIQEGGGGGFDAVIWWPNSTEGYQIVGDFDVALAKVQQGIPLVAILFSGDANSGGFNYYNPEYLGCRYHTANPNTINLWIDSVSGFDWTSSGIEFYYND